MSIYASNERIFLRELIRTILDQHAEVQAAGGNGPAVLPDVKQAILESATKDAVRDILDRTLSVAELIENPLLSGLGGIHEQYAIPRRLARLGGGLYQLSDSGIIVPDQGYVGFLAIDETGRAYDVFGLSAARGNEIKVDDPIQEACGDDFFYPPMMWFKALYSEAYRNRPESQRELTIQKWLAELAGEGFFQGSIPLETEGALAGATGFMPSIDTRAALDASPRIAEHFLGEPIEEFRGSGLMDQVALCYLNESTGILSPEISTLAQCIINAGGTLN